jgi:hypothetical protein
VRIAGVAFGAALLALIPAVARRSAAATDPQAPALIGTRGAGPVSLADAQRRVDFVIYLPTYLPPGAGEPRLHLAPEQALVDVYVPNRVYATYGGDISLWQMPTLGRPLSRRSVPINLGGRMGWAAEGPGKGKMTVEWRQGDTELGISAARSLPELIKIAGSAAQAAPQVSMAAPSAARRRYWAPVTELTAAGGIGVMLAPGIPPMVLSVEPGAPAARAGVRPGDIIVAVDGKSVERRPVADAMALIRGAPGTSVIITLTRSGEPQRIALTMRRAKLPHFATRELTLAQARNVMPFRLLAPGWMPPGYRLVSCVAVMRDGRPWETRLIYSAAGRALVVIGEGDDRARHLVVVPDGERTRSGPVRVKINGATGRLTTSGGLMLSWQQGGTAILLQSRALPRDAALRIARSMR